jgi:RNA polymerase sigma-70 factor (ECF subfamily)
VDGNIVLKGRKDNYMDLFEHIIDSHERKISRYIFGMIHDIHETKDLTQDVLINVYKNLYKYNPEYPIEPWLFKIAHNITLNYIKKNKKRMKEIPFLEVNEGQVSSGATNENIETRELILKEINSLQSELREIFLLRIMEDLSFEQIGEILNKSTASVKLKFYRSRKRIIDKISQYIKEGEI